MKEETNVGVLGPTYGCFLENIWSKDVPKVYTTRSPISDHNVNLDIWEVMLRHHIHHFFYAIIMGLKPLTLDFTSLSGYHLGYKACGYVWFFGIKLFNLGVKLWLCTYLMEGLILFIHWYFSASGDVMLPFNHIAMQSIRKSECPKELEPADRKTAVHVNLMRKEEDCPVRCLHLSAILFFFFLSTSNSVILINSI